MDENSVVKDSLTTAADWKKYLSNLLDNINNDEPNDDFTRSLQNEVELQRDDDGKRALYMTYNQTLLEMEERGKNAGKLETVLSLFKIKTH